MRNVKVTVLMCCILMLGAVFFAGACEPAFPVTNYKSKSIDRKNFNPAKTFDLNTLGEIRDLSGDYVAYCKDGKWGLYNCASGKKTKNLYNKIISASNNCLFLVETGPGKSRIINSDNRTLAEIALSMSQIEVRGLGDHTNYYIKLAAEERVLVLSDNGVTTFNSVPSELLPAACSGKYLVLKNESDKYIVYDKRGKTVATDLGKPLAFVGDSKLFIQTLEPADEEEYDFIDDNGDPYRHKAEVLNLDNGKYTTIDLKAVIYYFVQLPDTVNNNYKYIAYCLKYDTGILSEDYDIIYFDEKLNIIDPSKSVTAYKLKNSNYLVQEDGYYYVTDGDLKHKAAFPMNVNSVDIYNELLVGHTPNGSVLYKHSGERLYDRTFKDFYGFFDGKGYGESDNTVYEFDLEGNIKEFTSAASQYGGGKIYLYDGYYSTQQNDENCYYNFKNELLFKTKTSYNMSIQYSEKIVIILVTQYGADPVNIVLSR